jgi:hypothetical protein
MQQAFSDCLAYKKEHEQQLSKLLVCSYMQQGWEGGGGAAAAAEAGSRGQEA